METEDDLRLMAKKRRVTTGCKTCRIRRVKCDETRPTCKNCGKKNRICLYSGDGEISPREINGPSPQHIIHGTNIPSVTQVTTLHDAHPDSVNVSSALISDDSVSYSEQRRWTESDNYRLPSIPSLDQNNPLNAHLQSSYVFAQASNDPVADLDQGVQTPWPTFRPVGSDTSTELDELTPTADDDSSARISELARSPLAAFQNLGSILLSAERQRPTLLPLAIRPNAQDFSNVDNPNSSYDNGYQATSGSILLHVPNRIQLTDLENKIFRNYVERVSRWVDSFSHDRPFYHTVPFIALNCPALLDSCLALSCKQMALVESSTQRRDYKETSVRYYRKALKAISMLLADSYSAQSDELLAASIILSTYEMLDPIGENFGSHLKGVASLLQSTQANGNSRGIRGTAYWTWYRHEIWSSLHTGRRMTLTEDYWQPEALNVFDHLSVEDMANRALFIFGQCVSFCNDNYIVEGLSNEENLEARRAKSAALLASFDDWKKKLPSAMEPFLTQSQQPSKFASIWFIYPQSAIAHQVYHASRIILALTQPTFPSQNKGLGQLESLSTRRQIERSREQIFLVANSGIHEAWSLLSTQCLYIAGLVTEGVQERARTLELIEECQNTSGRQTSCIADELRKIWGQESNLLT